VSAAREEILGAVREALRGASPEYGPRPSGYHVAGQGDAVALFAERVAEYRASVVRAAEQDVAGVVERLVAGTVAVPDGLPGAWLPATVERAREPLGVEALDRVDAVITGCALAIGETGTIVLDGGPAQGARALTLGPDHHICVVRASQIVHSVPEAVRALGAAVRERRAPITFISGPSATSDIELERVEGVHGPRRLDVIVAQ
jgi:L-lactate dehydrogenase complex protein LldG